jgi:hypothetical protein
MSLASAGLEKRNPCPKSHCIPRSAVSCSLSSIPSAVICSPSVRPTLTMARARADSRGALGEPGDEALVDLQDVDRKSLEVRER